MRNKILILLFCIILILLSSCERTEEEKMSYIYDVEPIFISSCVLCHTAGHYSNLDLSSYNGLMAGESLNGPVIKAYYPDLSLLFEKIVAEQPSIGSPMPLGGSALTGTEIQVIELWIFDGAKNN